MAARVEQFLSYEGAFTAVGGPAERAASPRTSGSPRPAPSRWAPRWRSPAPDRRTASFAWTATTTSSFGAVNPGQTFSTSARPAPVATCPATLVDRGRASRPAPTCRRPTPTARSPRSPSRRRPSPASRSTDTGAGTARLDVAGDTAAGVVRRDDHASPPTTTRPRRRAARSGSPSRSPLTPISQVQGTGGGQPDARPGRRSSRPSSRRCSPPGRPDQRVLRAGGGRRRRRRRGHVRGRLRRLRGAPARPASPPATSSSVAGVVTEDFAMTQLEATAHRARSRCCRSGNALPDGDRSSTSRPAARRDAAATFESVEGMVVTFADTLAVSEYFELARFGQLVLTAGERPYQFTHDNAPERRRLHAPSSPSWRRAGSSSTTTTTTRTTPSSTVRPTSRTRTRRPGLLDDEPLPRRRHDHRPDRRAAVVVRRLAGPARSPDRATTRSTPANPRARRARRRRRRPAGRQLQRPQLLHDDRHDVVERRRPVRAVGHARLPRRRLRRRARAHSGPRSSPRWRRSTPTSSG